MTDVEAIRLAKTMFREGYNRGNVDLVLSAFGDAFSDMSVACPSFYGQEAPAVMRHRLRQLFAKYRARMVVTVFSIAIEGGFAFDRGQHALTLTPKKGGRPRTIRTRYLEIWRKNPEGQWKIAIYFDNLDMPPAMPPREVLRAMRAKGRGTPPRKSSNVRASRRKPVVS